ILQMILAQDNVDVNIKDDDGNNALHITATTGNFVIIDPLLQHPQIDVEASNSSSVAKFFTPLWLTVSHSHKPAAQVLLEHGANAEAADTLDRKTPLHVATEKGNADIVELLLDHGANTETHDQRGFAPLWAAANKGKEDIFSLLLD
ncbi:ankyrin repeat-containing domain protein, partial [Immersiella caudata]